MCNTHDILTILCEARKNLELMTKVLIAAKTQSITRQFLLFKTQETIGQLDKIMGEDNHAKIN